MSSNPMVSRLLGQLLGVQSSPMARWKVGCGSSVSSVRDGMDVAIRVQLAGGAMVLDPCRYGDSSPTVAGVPAFILNFSQ